MQLWMIMQLTRPDHYTALTIHKTLLEDGCRLRRTMQTVGNAEFMLHADGHAGHASRQ